MKFHGFLLLFLVAGCIDSNQAPNDGGQPTLTDETPRETHIERSSDTDAVQDQFAGLTGAMQMDDCFMRRTTFVWPLKTAPGDPPEHWSGDSFQWATGTFHIYYECHRMNATGLERGPVLLLIEAHDNLPYNDCTKDTSTLHLTPFKVYVQGPDLAEHVRAVWGQEVVDVYFDRTTDETVPGAAVEALTMNVVGDDGPAIDLHFVYSTQTEYAMPDREAYYWDVGDGVQMWLLETESEVYSVDSPITRGTFGPPTVMAQQGFTNTPILAGAYRDMTLKGQFTWLPNGECKE